MAERRDDRSHFCKGSHLYPFLSNCWVKQAKSPATLKLSFTQPTDVTVSISCSKQTQQNTHCYLKVDTHKERSHAETIKQTSASLQEQKCRCLSARNQWKGNWEKSQGTQRLKHTVLNSTSENKLLSIFSVMKNESPAYHKLSVEHSETCEKDIVFRKAK